MVGGVTEQPSVVDGFLSEEGLVGVPGHPQVWDRSFLNPPVRGRLLNKLDRVREIGKAPHLVPPAMGFSTVVVDNCCVQDREPGWVEHSRTLRWD